MNQERGSNLQDRRGRLISSLRISITDRCNLRCIHCMPAEGMRWIHREEILTFEEIQQLARIAVGMGINKIRVTGGEPLARADVAGLIGLLASIDGLKDLSLTTNGYLLEGLAEELARAGLRRVNISLDSLDQKTFNHLVRGDAFERVWRGLEAALRFFPGPVKVNAVIHRGLNDHEIENFARLARLKCLELRFIEFMPLDAEQSWRRDNLVPGEEIRERIHRIYPLKPDPAQDPRSPSRDYLFADGGGGKIGLINSVTSPFCDSCNRVRITADGKLRTCLFSRSETDLRKLLRGGFGEEAIAKAIRAAIREKEPGHEINQPNFTFASRSISQVGG